MGRFDFIKQPHGVTRFSDIENKLHKNGHHRLPKNPRSLIMVLFPYYFGEQHGNLSAYCSVPDYHVVAGDILSGYAKHLSEIYPDNDFVPMTDISPIPEVYAAYLAGLGVIGENGLLINKQYGSYVFIGELVTDCELPPDEPIRGGCLSCGRCKSACPTGFLCGMGECLSLITQKKGELNKQEISLVKAGGMAFGCDVCSKVCPMNKGAAYGLYEFINDVEGVVTPENVDRLCETRAFGYRKNSIKRNITLIMEGTLS